MTEKKEVSEEEKKIRYRLCFVFFFLTFTDEYFQAADVGKCNHGEKTHSFLTLMKRVVSVCCVRRVE